MPKTSRLKFPAMAALFALMLLVPAASALAAVSAPEFRAICQTGSLKELNSALAGGAEVNGADSSGRTALHFAVGSGRVEMARRLLAAGAEVNVYDDAGFSPLLYACREMTPGTEATRKVMIELLLAAGADVRPGVIKESGRPSTPPLMAAASHTGPEIIKLLLRAGCLVDLASHTGYTPLMAAAEFNGDSAAVAALLAAGADPRLADTWGDTALDMARLNRTPAAGEIAAMLEAALKKAAPPENK